MHGGSTYEGLHTSPCRHAHHNAVQGCKGAPGGLLQPRVTRAQWCNRCGRATHFLRPARGLRRVPCIGKKRRSPCCPGC